MPSSLTPRQRVAAIAAIFFAVGTLLTGVLHSPPPVATDGEAPVAAETVSTTETELLHVDLLGDSWAEVSTVTVTLPARTE